MVERNSPASAENGRALERAVATSALDIDGTEFWKGLIASTSEGLVTVDEDGTIVFANPALERILGYRPDELVGRRLLTLIPDGSARERVRAFQRRLGTAERQLDWSDVDLPVRHREGHEVSVSMRFREHAHEGQRLVTGVVRNVVEREAYERELERRSDAMDTAMDGMALLDDEGKYAYVNQAHADVYGYDDTEAFLGESWKMCYDGDSLRRFEAEVMPELFETGEWRGEAIGQRADGSTFPQELSLTALDDGGIICVVRDVTERKRNERELEHERDRFATLFDTLPAPVVYGVQRDGVLRVEDANERFEEVFGFDRSNADGLPVQDVLALPDELAGVDDVTERIVEAGGALRTEVQLETADGVRDFQFHVVVREHESRPTEGYAIYSEITDQKERERTLERQRTALERIQQVTRSLRPLNRALARASTREEIERLACEHLAMSDAYRFAWYGDYNPDVERVTPEAWGGVEDGHLGDFDATADGSDADRGLAGRAVRTGDVQTARGVLTEPAFGPWREDALARGYQSAAAVPVVFGGTAYGVIGVYSSRPNAFDEYEQGLLRELGERVGHAIHAAENKRLLHTDTVVELEFQTTGTESVFVESTEELGCRLELETVVPASGNSFLCYATVDGATPEAVVERLSNSPAIDRTRTVDAVGTAGTIEYRVSESPMTKLLGYGATVTSKVIEEGEATIVGEVAPEADTHAIIAGMQATYSDTTFVAKRTVDRPVQSLAATRGTLDDVVTERQRQVLGLAYHAGFFESPRHSTGDELADALGIASPTFYLHVRKATRRLLERLVETGLLE